MLIEFPSPEKILLNINKLNTKRVNDFLILCGEDVKLDFLALIELLNQHEIRFCGGIFPGVIHSNKCFSNKVLLLPVQFDSVPYLIQGLDNGDINIPALSFPNPLGSLFILVDGLSNWISKFLFSLYNEIGSEFQVFGSGTGFGTFSRNECIFCKEGFFKDAALVVLLKNPITQSIQHGWKTIAGPYLATKTSANLLEQINWRPAFEVYKEIVEKEEQVELTEDNYYQYLMHYPFGIFRSEGENLIRDPVELEENQSIRFGAEIPSNSVLYLMKSDIKAMLLAGSNACNDVVNRTKQPEFLFIADCISRTWILSEQFNEELENIALNAENKEIPVYGVLAMGEISSANGTLLDYHHKTIVISTVENNGQQ